LNFPTKKLFFYFLPIIVIVGLFAIWNSSRTSSVKNGTASLSVAGENSLINNQLEAGGKFKDWQDALIKQAPSSSSKNPSYSDAANKTENLSKQLFSDYLGLKDSGQANNTEAVKQTADRIAQGVSAINVKTSYAKKDLKINTAANDADLALYANKLGEIRQKYRDRFVEKASSDIYISPSDANFQTNISLAASLFASEAKELLALSVPSELADLHVRLVNSYAGSGVGLEKMKLLENDPLMSAVGIKQFDSESQNELVVLEELRTKLSASGIVFTQGDSALFLWTN